MLFNESLRQHSPSSQKNWLNLPQLSTLKNVKETFISFGSYFQKKSTAPNESITNPKIINLKKTSTRIEKNTPFYWSVLKGMTAAAAVFLSIDSVVTKSTGELVSQPAPFPAGRHILAVPTATIPDLDLTEEVGFSKTWLDTEIFGTAQGGGQITVTAQLENGLPQGITLSNKRMLQVGSLAQTNLLALAQLGNYIYTSTLNINSLLVIDTNQNMIVNSIPTPGGISDIACAVNLCYVVHSLGYLVVSVNDPLNPVILSSTPLSNAQAIAISGKLGVIIQRATTGTSVPFNVVDFSDPTRPTYYNSTTLPAVQGYAYNYDPIISGNFAFIAGILKGLITVDLSNPRYPVIRNILPLPSSTGSPYGTYISNIVNKGNICFLNANNDGIFAVDVSNPDNPVILSSTEADPIAAVESLALDPQNDQYLYILKGNQIVIMDINDPKKPVIVERITLQISTLTGPAQKMLITNNSLLIADNMIGLRNFTKGDTINLSGAPLGGTKGNYTAAFTATNSNGTVVGSQSFNLNINPAIKVLKPSSIIEVVAVAGSSFIYNLDSKTFNQINGAVLSYSAKLIDGSPLPAWMNINSVSGALSVNPTVEDVGNLEIEITARDPFGASAQKIVKLRTIYGPTSIQTQRVQAAVIGKHFIYNPGQVFEDLDGESLTTSATTYVGLPLETTWITYNTTTGNFEGDPTTSDLGLLQLSYKATDEDGFTKRVIISINVVEEGTITVLNPIPNTNANADQELIIDIPDDTFNLPAGCDSLTYTVAGTSWLKLVGNSIRGTPSKYDSNFFSGSLGQCTLTATCEGESNSLTFDIIMIGETNAVYFAKILGITATCFSGLLILYKLRGTISNVCNKKRYRRLETIAYVGEKYVHPLEIKRTDIKNFETMSVPRGQQTPCKGCVPHWFYDGFWRVVFRSNEKLPGGKPLPDWLQYNVEDNLLESKDIIPDIKVFKSIKICVLGNAGRIIEELPISVQHRYVAQNDRYLEPIPLKEIIIQENEQKSNNHQRDNLTSHVQLTNRPSSPTSTFSTTSNHNPIMTSEVQLAALTSRQVLSDELV